MDAGNGTVDDYEKKGPLNERCPIVALCKTVFLSLS